MLEAEQLKNGEKDVQQVEIDLHRRWHVIVFAVGSGPHDPPCVENEQSAEHEDRPCERRVERGGETGAGSGRQ